MNLHQKHKILRIDDEENLKKENLTIEFSQKEFDADIQKLDILKNSIEKEMMAIDKEYERVNDETTKSFNSKREKLKQDEEDLKDRLKNEVTKIKENMEDSLSKVNNLLRTCEKIKKGINSLEKEKKEMIQTLSYISCINKNQLEMNSLINSKIKNLKINFNEEESIIEYSEYYFNWNDNTLFDNNKLILNKEENIKVPNIDKPYANLDKIRGNDKKEEYYYNQELKIKEEPKENYYNKKKKN